MPDFKEEARIIRELTRAENGPDPFSSAVRSTRMPMLITDPRQPDNPIVFANAAFSRLTGYNRRDINGQNRLFLQGPDTDQTDVARLRDAIDARETIELDLLNYRSDGSTFWNRLLVSPVFDDEGQLTYFFASQFDVTLEKERLVQLLKDREALEAEVFHRNADLLASEQRLRLALEAGRLGTWSIDLNTGHLSASAACKEICGWPRDEPLSLDQLRNLIHPEDRQLQLDAISEAIETGHLLDTEYRLILQDGGERWVQLRGQANYRADGSPVSVVGTTQDVTERRNAQTYNAMLATEMNHRLKNTLTSMQAIITQTFRSASDLEDAATSIKSRIRAMTDANDLLISGRFEGGTVPQLLDNALTPFGVSDTGQFTLRGPDVAIPAHFIGPMALAIHELAINATKYGALSVAGGSIFIEWDVRVTGEGRMLDLRWLEQDGPPVEAPTHTGFGTRLIDRTLRDALNARVEISYPPSGLRFAMSARLDQA